MEIERVFMSCFFIEKKPTDIFDLIEAALQVGAKKYPVQFEKRKNKIINMIMHFGDYDDLILDEDDNVGGEDKMIKKEEPEKQKKSSVGAHKITSPTNQKPTMKIKLSIKKTVEVSPHKKLLYDCSPQKQSSYRTITRTMHKTTQSSAVVRPMQKETQNIENMEMKFQSSKRKLKERLAEQRKIKKRTVMVDFQDMPKPINDFRYTGKELYFEQGKFQRLKLLNLDKLEGLKQVTIGEGAVPHLEKLVIQRSALLETVTTGIECLLNLKVLEFFDMPDEFIMTLRPDKLGADAWKVSHIPEVFYTY
ncbi:hypothetical protein KY285_001865 [Solanum tuberosum]|nr:hypothetical protein KY289_002139 [Solanum tuberosum]KAH0765994.1 hypothetical protein KY285_001865 [Solanum tuberosum]